MPLMTGDFYPNWPIDQLFSRDRVSRSPERFSRAEAFVLFVFGGAGTGIIIFDAAYVRKADTVHARRSV